MKKQYLEVGQIVTVQGIKGEVRVNPWCDDPDFLLDFDSLYFAEKNKSGEITYSEIKIENARSQKNIVVMKLEGINTVEEAQRLRNKIFYMSREDVELDEGVYFVQDLIGLKVIDADDNNKVYGEIVEVSQTGANDVYHIKAEDAKLYYIPAIPQVVITTDIENCIMEIRPLKGLFEDED